VKIAFIVVLLALLVCLGLLAPAAAAAPANGSARAVSVLAPFAIETGHALGYVALSLFVLEILLGLSMRFTLFKKNWKTMRWVHLTVGTLILIVVIAHVLTVEG